MKTTTLLQKGLIAAGAATAISLGMSAPAQAFTFVGSYEVNDGPSWPDNPPVYSAREAAALIFGGVAEDYLVSIYSDSITNTGWYDGWGDHRGVEFDQDYKLDLGLPGYNDPGGYATAYSAYVRDGLSDSYVNYVFRNEARDVPTPAAVLPVLGGLLAAARRRKNDEVEEA